MFSNTLKAELAQLRNELASMRQIKDSLYSEMLVLEFEPDGRVRYANDNFLSPRCSTPTMHYSGRPLDSLIPRRSARKPTMPVCSRRCATASTSAAPSACSAARSGGLAARHLAAGAEQPRRTGLLHPLCQRPDPHHRHPHEHGADRCPAAFTAVIEFNLSGEVLTANQRFLDSMGYRLEQIRGKHHRLFCSAEEANSQEYRDLGSLNRGEYVAGRFQRVDSHGHPASGWRPHNPIVDSHDRLVQGGQSSPP